jgi:acetylornithine/N-succinyldiaminopimelate aminotransferase
MTLFERDSEALFSTYRRLPLEFVRGEGMELQTADGEHYLDMFSGVAVNALGYAHPGVLRAIREQSERYIHISNYYLQEPQIVLAERLREATGCRRVFFANTGAETVEGALKIARRWGADKGKNQVLTLSNAFHGRTMGALSMMDRPGYREGFGPFLPNCETVAHNDTNDLRRLVGAQTAAVMLEFIQGEGGIRPVSPEFVGALEELRARYGFLLVADEIQSGIGRTGNFSAYEHYGITPDLILVAKPLGGGLPLGAILAGEKTADVLQPGMHGTTFGGNPVACAAGAVVLEEIINGGLMDNAARVGSYMKERLEDLAGLFPDTVREVRGMGLMLGMELSSECTDVVAAMRDRHILINCTERTVLRFLPPLIVEPHHVEKTVDALGEVLGSLELHSGI